MIENLTKALQKKMSCHQRNHSPLPIMLSIGGVMFHEETSLEYLYELADQYLYQVKSGGRDNYNIVTFKS